MLMLAIGMLGMLAMLDILHIFCVNPFVEYGSFEFPLAKDFSFSVGQVFTHSSSVSNRRAVIFKDGSRSLFDILLVGPFISQNPLAIFKDIELPFSMLLIILKLTIVLS